MSLRIEHVSFSYAELPVLHDISFDVPAGDFLSLLGPNGSGKTTLLRLLDRILLPQRGTIALKGRTLQQYSRKEIARLVAYVPQDTLWVFPFTVLEVVLMGRSPYVGRSGFESQLDLDVALEMMRLTDIEHIAEKPITALSGGERQRVLIARALSQQPQILLLDEPNAHLDISHQLEIFQILREQNAQHNLTIVSVSHDLNLAAAFSKRVMLLAQRERSGWSAGCHDFFVRYSGRGSDRIQYRACLPDTGACRSTPTVSVFTHLACPVSRSKRGSPARPRRREH